LGDIAMRKPIEIWFQDEARIGQKNGLVRQWARRGTRPRQPADQRYESAYLFGAICPARGTGAALALPYADTQAMQLHLDEIARTVKRGAHAVLLLDRAGWHTSGALAIPQNMTLILLPARAPELNPVENIWQYLRQTWLSNRVSTPTRRSLRLPARLGAGSSPNPTPSPQSAHGNGPPPVKDEGRWYYSLPFRPAAC
jgi:DDE superfamily endonuclease